MAKLIFINGAPGVGKTTTSKLLQQKLNSPFIDFGHLREFHLDRTWSNHSKEEEQMAFENLVFILKNYIKNNYINVIVTDLLEERTQQISQFFDKDDYMIFTLFVAEDEVLKARVLEESRDSGYRNFEKALIWNRELSGRELLQNEIKIDNTLLPPTEVVELICHKI